ncbi:MAG: PD-(D/E)XK motif protein [Parachlamydiaceae bacterium]
MNLKMMPIWEKNVNNPWNTITPPSNDVSARRIDHTHPLDLFWARDFHGYYLLICEVDSEDRVARHKLPELAGIDATFMPLEKKIRLILTLNENANWEMFFALCNDLVEATRCARSSADAVSIIQRRLVKWSDFLKKRRSGILEEQAIRGLIGELHFIKKYLIPGFGPSAAVSFWMGPEGAAQDFSINDSAIEVKCQLGTTHPYVRISSAEQLSPQLPEMYLYVVTLGKARADHPDAVTLPWLVAYIRSELEAEAPQQAERFNNLMLGLGYFDSEKYLEFSYVIADSQMFEVREGFPKIPIESLRSGIIKVTYDISIAECLPFEKWPEWIKG